MIFRDKRCGITSAMGADFESFVPTYLRPPAKTSLNRNKPRRLFDDFRIYQEPQFNNAEGSRSIGWIMICL
jgi:hypothetical protein